MNPFMKTESFSAVPRYQGFDLQPDEQWSKTLLVEDEFGGSTKYRLVFFIPEIAIPFLTYLTYEYHGNFPDGPGFCERGFQAAKMGIYDDFITTMAPNG